jgi:hypothetical protein
MEPLAVHRDGTQAGAGHWLEQMPFIRKRDTSDSKIWQVEE